jgi:hypothetical protein
MLVIRRKNWHGENSQPIDGWVKWTAVPYRAEKAHVMQSCAKQDLNDVAQEIAPVGSSLDNPCRGKVSTNMETCAAYTLSQSVLWVVT